MSELVPPPPRNVVGQRIVSFGDRFVEEIRHFLNAQRFERHITSVEHWTSHMALLAALIGFALGLLVAIKTDSGYAALSGMLWLGLVAVVYYTGIKALTACYQTVRSNQTSISSPAILDLLGMYFSIAAISVLVYGIYEAIDSSNWRILLGAVVGSAVLTYLVVVTLTPSLVSLTVDPETSAGGDIIALTLLVAKTLVRLSGIMMGVAVTIGVLNGSMLLYTIFESPLYYFDIDRAGIFIGLVIGGLFIPLMAYLAFITLFLLSDVLLALLRLHRIATHQRGTR